MRGYANRGARDGGDGGFRGGQQQDVLDRRAADAKQRLLRAPACRAGRGDGKGERNGQRDAGQPEKQEQHRGVQRILADRPEARAEIVGDQGLAGDPRLEIVLGGGDESIGRDGIRRQRFVGKAHMQLQPGGVGARLLLRIEHLPPGLQRQDEDVVGWSLRRGLRWQADSLEQSVGVREVDHAGNPDLGRRQADPLDRDRVAGTDMEVGGCLLGNQRAVEGAGKRADLRRKIAGISAVESNRLAWPRGLGRAAGSGLETGDIGIADLMYCFDGSSFAQRLADEVRIGTGNHLHLPVDWNRRHGAGGHRCTGVGEEERHCREQGDRQRDAGGSTGDAQETAGKHTTNPQQDHHAAAAPAGGR